MILLGHYMNTLISPINPDKPIIYTDELLIIDSYLEKNVCDRLITYAEWCPRIVAPVADIKGDKSIGTTQLSTFVAERIEFCREPQMSKECLSIVKNIIKNNISLHYKVGIEWFEFPHILYYKSGGIYEHHSDADTFDTKSKRWLRVMDRDFSIILYLNSAFSGGGLAFPHQNLRVQPRTGLLVVFPSDYRYVHKAEPTISGKRYALVTWVAKQGGSRVMNRLPNNIVRLD